MGRHCRGQRQPRVCLDCPCSGAALAAAVRDRGGLHHPPGNRRRSGAALRGAACLLRSRDVGKAPGRRSDYGQRQGARPLSAGDGGNRCRQACLLRVAARPRHRGGHPHARRRGAKRRAACGGPAGPDVAGNQLRQGPYRRGLCRAGADRHDDWLRAELGRRDRPGISGRARKRRQSADDHRRASDRCPVPLPRRIPRADCVRGEPARPHPIGGDRRTRRQGHAGPAHRERHRRRRECRGGGRIVPDPWRHDPRHRVPVRDPRRPRRSCADSHDTRLDAASGTDGPRGPGRRAGACGIAGPGSVSLGSRQPGAGLAVQCRSALCASGGKH